jgi:glycosyltransferase involved in cell wall biosynthesis
MQGFDLFVLPSFNEGISNTILEAMSTSLPVMASTMWAEIRNWWMTE